MSFFKKIRVNKAGRIILVLILLNLVAFSATSNLANRYSPDQLGNNQQKNMNYIEKGWQIVNWSYNLLKYFKKPQTDIPS
ncbi:MAG: hypothetical protein H6605_08780 [Flavobacteriales bacterium]|nr:hypothetical protein [Flavobacteriales bacterium]